MGPLLLLWERPHSGGILKFTGDNMGLWKAVHTCYVQGVLLEGNGIIELTEDQEKEEQLGKYAIEVPDQKALRKDPKSTKTIKQGNVNLIKVNRSAVSGKEGQAIDEGMILYPPAKNPVERGDSHGGANATQFQTVR